MVLSVGVAERLAVFGKFPYPRKERAATFLADNFPSVGPLEGDRQGGPKMPGWSVPSATIVSGLPAPKSKEYLVAPAALTFISSGNRLLDGLSFHLPTKTVVLQSAAKDSEFSSAKVSIEAWRRQYNEVWPHSSLGYLSPAAFKAKHLRNNAPCSVVRTDEIL